MTGGQSLLALEQAARGEAQSSDADPSMVALRAPPPSPSRSSPASAEEIAAHAQLTQLLQKASGGRCLWLTEVP